MKFTNLAEGFTYTVAAAAFIALVVWAFSWLRNLQLEKQLVDAINPNGVGVGFDPHTHTATFDIQVHNYADASIRVRSIVFMAKKWHIELTPAKGGRLYQTPLSNEIVRPAFKRKFLSKTSLVPDNNPHSVLLPPKTMAVWEVASDRIGAYEWVITEIFMVFEYATIFGNSALVRMEASESTLNLVKSEFERLSKSVHHKLPYDIGLHLPKNV